MRLILFAAFFLTAFSNSFAQETPKPKKEKETLVEIKASRKFNPSIGAGIGATRFFGDVEDVNATNIHRLGNRLAYNFTFRTNLSRCFNLSLSSIFGKLSGNENEHREHRNFESKMFSMGLNVEYNFKHFYNNKKRKPFITPFISAGIYYADYTPRTDLYDSKGNYYYYWQDGVIRNLPEGIPNTDEAKVLERDYKYETTLTEKPVTTIAFPVAGGFDLHVSERVTFRISASYFFTLSDKLDNVIDNKRDGYYYNSIGVLFNFLSEKDDKIPGVDPDYNFVDFESLDFDDSDNDGVPDLEDNCGNTPPSVQTDANGCPLDMDRDGIADYLDKEPNSKIGSVVDANGVMLNFMNIAENTVDAPGLSRSKVNDAFVFSEKSTDSQYTVHVATYGNTIPANEKRKLNNIDGLVETKKDTLTIYTLGSFANFADAQNKQNELLSQGYDQAFAATPKAVNAIALELEKRSVIQMKENNSVREINPELPVDKDVVKFKVQLTEYRLRLQVDKLADLMAREGVELKTTIGGLKIYIIGAYDTYEQAKKIRKEILGYGVKEAGIVGSINNSPVSVEEAQKFLENLKK